MRFIELPVAIQDFIAEACCDFFMSNFPEDDYDEEEDAPLEQWQLEVLAIKDD